MLPCQATATFSLVNRVATSPTDYGLAPMREAVVHVVPAQLLLEVQEGRAGIDKQVLQARHFGEILEVLRGECLAVGGMMRAASEDPGSRRDFEVRLWMPDGACDRQLRQRVLWLYRVNLVHDEPEAITHVD